MELRVKVCLFYSFVYFFQEIYHFCRSHSFKFVLHNEKITLFENSIISFTANEDNIKNGPIDWNHNTQIRINDITWKPSLDFVPQKIKNNFKDNLQVTFYPWVIIDEFF
jgi:hypothetical protein